MRRVPLNLAMWQVSPAMGPLKLHGAKRWWDMTLKCPRFQWGGHQDQVGCGHRPLGWSDAKRRLPLVSLVAFRAMRKMCWLRIDTIRTLGGTFPCRKVFHKVLVPKGECQWIVTYCNHSEPSVWQILERGSWSPSWSEDRAYCMELTYNYGTWDRRSSDRCRTSLGYKSACRGRCCKARKFLEF